MLKSKDGDVKKCRRELNTPKFDLYNNINHITRIENGICCGVPITRSFSHQFMSSLGLDLESSVKEFDY